RTGVGRGDALPDLVADLAGGAVEVLTAVLHAVAALAVVLAAALRVEITLLACAASEVSETAHETGRPDEPTHRGHLRAAMRTSIAENVSAALRDPATLVARVDRA